MKRGDELIMTVERYGAEGKGVARLDGFVVFVRGGVPGDVVCGRLTRVRKNFADAEIASVTTPSLHRVTPRCRYFGTCGGCVWQHLAYPAQREFKRQQVRDALEHIGGFAGIEVQPTLGADDPYYYRNKMEFSFGVRWLTREELDAAEHRDREQSPLHRFALGLHIPQRFDRVLDVHECFLQSAESAAIVNAVREFAEMRELTIYSTLTHTGYLRNLVIREGRHTGDRMVNLVTSEDRPELMHEFAGMMRTRFPSVTTIVNNITTRKSQVATGDREVVLYGPGFIRERLGTRVYNISANSFFQTNTLQAERLYDTVRQMADLRPTDTVFDLYSGTGTIALHVAADAASVVGVESVPGAVADAQRNAAEQGITNCTFLLGDLKERIVDDTRLVAEHGSPTVIIADPPRAGMHPKVVTRIKEMHSQRIVYVSCNPATQARDLKVLCADGAYTIDRVQPVDMFPHTMHVENVVRLISALLALALCVNLPAGAATPDKTQRSIAATRAIVPPRIDGYLTDSCWQLAEPSSEFTQFDPREGAAPTEETSVRLLYNDNALFVGVACGDRVPQGIVRQLSRRDRSTEADRFTVMIDSFFDRQTGFVFSTNVSGVQSDGVLSQGGSVYDITWDAVWQVETKQGPWGWSAEFVIPWSALRFSERREGVYTWGINFRRYISRKRETIEWVMVPRSERYSIPFWGTIRGIQDIHAPLHLEIAPYASALQTSTTGNVVPPARSSHALQYGLDVKYGLARNFTLDATLNPDFGQVEVDASVLNLTVFETLFPEKRPFFLEGAQMFTFGGAGDNTPLTLFFSRRIGREPVGSSAVAAPAGGTVEENPRVTTILGAAKLTGRTASGLSIAALTSLTDEEQATLWSPDGRTTVRTEPMGSYSILRVKQESGEGSWYGGIATLAARDKMHPALSGGIDWNQRFARGKYTADGYLAGARGYSSGVLHDGAAGRLLLMRISAEHWFPAISYDFATPEFSINDLGFFAQPRDHGGYFQMLYRENNSSGIFRRYYFNVNPEVRWNWDDAVLTHAVMRLEAIGELRNFWQLDLLYTRRFPAYDDKERGILGLYRRPGSNDLTLTVLTDERRAISANITGGMAFGDKGEQGATLQTTLTVRPTSWMELSPAMYYQRAVNAIAWVYPGGTIIDNTISNVPVSLFGTRNLEQLDLSLRGIVTFTRTLSVQFFLQSFVARGEYRHYTWLAADGRLHPYASGAYGSLFGGNDFNAVNFNANVLLRWEYLPGSSFYFVWTQGRFGDTGDYGTGAVRRIGDTWTLPRQDAIVLKATYWFSM